MTSGRERDALISTHTAVARRIARRIARRCPAWMSRADLEGAALVGLTEAAARYEPARGEPFLGFAIRRIRGAVLDELRRGDLLPRRVRQLARRVDEVIGALQAERGGTPDDAVVAAALGVSVDRYHRELRPLAAVRVDPLADLERTISGSSDPSPASLAERNQLRAVVRRGLAQLDPRDAAVLWMLHGQGLPCAEVARCLRVSSSRVCQLNGRALDRLRSMIEGAGAVAA